jgi:hypothetical protein
VESTRAASAALQRCKICESYLLGFGTGRDTEWSLNDGQRPNFRGVRVALGTGYNRVEGNRRASRNGRVSDLPPEIPTVTIRGFCVAVCLLVSNTSAKARWRADVADRTYRRVSQLAFGQLVQQVADVRRQQSSNLVPVEQLHRTAVRETEVHEPVSVTIQAHTSVCHTNPRATLSARDTSLWFDSQAPPSSPPTRDSTWVRSRNAES